MHLHDNEKEKLGTIADLELNDDASDIPKTSPLKTCFNVMKTMVGAGIFSTAYALNNSGFIFGVALIVILGFVFYWTIMTYVKSSVLSETKDAQSLISSCFGRTGEFLLNTTFILNAWGTIIGYSIIIGDVFPDVFNTIMGAPQTMFMEIFLSRRGQLVFVTLCVLLPISFARSLHGLANFSAAALAGIIFIIGSILAVGPTLDVEYKGNPNTPSISTIHGGGILSAIGIFSFAYVCHQNLLLNYHQMQNSHAKLKTFSYVAKATLLITVAMTLAIGCAWLTFKEKSTSNILNAFPKSNTIMVICKMLFGIDMCFTYPLELYVVRDTIEMALFKNRPFSQARHIIITLCIVSSTLLLSCITCDLGMVIELTGGVAAGAIAFIFPGACWLQANKNKGVHLTLKERLPHIICIVFGFGVMILTVAMVVVNALSSSDTKDCHW